MIVNKNASFKIYHFPLKQHLLSVRNEKIEKIFVQSMFQFYYSFIPYCYSNT